jgi:hypothetical protein
LIQIFWLHHKLDKKSWVDFKTTQKQNQRQKKLNIQKNTTTQKFLNKMDKKNEEYEKHEKPNSAI